MFIIATPSADPNRQPSIEICEWDGEDQEFESTDEAYDAVTSEEIHYLKWVEFCREEEEEWARKRQESQEQLRRLRTLREELEKHL